MIAFPSNRNCPRCKGEMQYICLTSIPPQYKARCLYCGYEEGENAKQPQTNADRIRAMSDEELAQWLDDISKACYYEGYTKETDEPQMSPYPTSPAKWVTWLKQEAKE